MMFKAQHLPFLLISLCVALSCAHKSPDQLRWKKRSPSSRILEQLPDTIDVLVWNAYKGSKRDFREDAFRLMKKTHLNIFQECVQEKKFDEVISLFNRLEVEEATSWGLNGVCTSSQVKSLETQAIKTEVRELFFFTSKATLITTYPMISRAGDIKELLVINVHMINFRAITAFREHLEQLRPRLETHEGPVIVAGDFNTWVDARKRVVTEFFKEFEIEEVQFAKDKNNLDPRASFFGVLDRAFIRGLEVKKTQVYQEVMSSDHKPFSMQLTLL